MSDIPRAHPPAVADETTLLRSFLDYYRATLLRQAEGLDRAQLARTLPGEHPTTLTLGGLVKHMAGVEDWWFGAVLFDEPWAEPFGSVDWDSDPDWEFRTAVDDEPAYLSGLLTAAVERSNKALDGLESLDVLAARSQHGRQPNARWIVVHMIEEYARHCGHADLLREAIDGETGI